jgi:hypothetical protein
MRVRFIVILGLAMCNVATSANAQSPFTCLKPWAVPDKWIDRHDDPNDGVWTTDDTFETVDAQGNPLSDPDVYVNVQPPYELNSGTGFQVPRDLGALAHSENCRPAGRNEVGILLRDQHRNCRRRRQRLPISDRDLCRDAAVVLRGPAATIDGKHQGSYRAGSCGSDQSGSGCRVGSCEEGGDQQLRAVARLWVCEPTHCDRPRIRP